MCFSIYICLIIIFLLFILFDCNDLCKMIYLYIAIITYFRKWGNFGKNNSYNLKLWIWRGTKWRIGFNYYVHIEILSTNLTCFFILAFLSNDFQISAIKVFKWYNCKKCALEISSVFDELCFHSLIFHAFTALCNWLIALRKFCSKEYFWNLIEPQWFDITKP